MNMNCDCPTLVVRPYQLLCVICSVGEGSPGSERIEEIRSAVMANPDRPLTVVCNAGDVYAYQDPGTGEDTAEGADYCRKRDLDILQRMNWPPGIILPARTAIMSLLKTITTVSGICGYEAVTSDAWEGCPKARSGDYEKGQQEGIDALIPPRTEEEMAEDKERSLEAMYSAGEVTIRPHILLCAVCQYGGGTRPPYKPDNLPELLELILTTKPGLLIQFARGADWMMCAPCHKRVPELNACVNVLGSGGLSNEKRDLDMLQKLGLKFGDSMGARDLFRLIFERFPTTQEICQRHNPCPSVWWDGCGESNMKGGNEDYEKGRMELMEKLGYGTENSV